MEMSPSSHVVLGMLSVGARSGYEVKATMDRSARFFWALSPVQVYPELKRLERAGLVEGRDDPQGGRRRRLYRLTADGEAVLREWLAGPEELSVQWRDTALLKLFFADALEPERALELVRRMRERSERLVAEFNDRIEPLAATQRERSGKDFPALTARFGREFNEWVIGWCEQVESELAGDPGR